MTHIHYRKDTDLPWRRVKKENGFAFLNQEGKRVGKKARKRIESLAIPPGWKEVIITSDPLDYIQAIGVDDRGRRQYIYHPEWVRRRSEKKFDQLVSFGERLPSLREVVRAHMRERFLSQNRIIATVVWLLENTFIRVGNKKFADENQSYGLTTMREKHVKVRGDTIKFSFQGKSGVYHELGVKHPRVAKTIRECLDLPGYEIFQYVDENGNKKVVDASEVNSYLQEHTGAPFSAKDFRTWGGSVIAGDSLYRKGKAETSARAKKNISDVVATVCEHLGNTKKVCRTYYIHPVIISSYLKDILVPHFAHSYGRTLSRKMALTPEEYATWSLIRDQ